MRIRVYPYKQGSKSAKSLATAMGGKVLKIEGSQFRPRQGDLIINWGSSQEGLAGYPIDYLNREPLVGNAANKLIAFQKMEEAGVNVPDFWTDRANIPADAYPIVARTVLNGHSGNGIVICNSPEELVAAPLYVRYVKKKAEYRVHVVNESIIAVQRKAKRNGEEPVNWQVRNLANGFVYVREGVNPPAMVNEQALLAINALGLDFGAVDIIWNDNRQEAYVLEINTAPGLEGQTVEDYARAFTNQG